MNSPQLYRSAAGAETFAVICYAILSLCCVIGTVLTWPVAWTPLLIVAALACARMAGSHWRERGDLLETAKQIEESE